MAVISRCPHCNKRLKVAEDLVGKRARCPACKTPFTINSVELPHASVAEPSLLAFETMDGARDMSDTRPSSEIAQGAGKRQIGRFELKKVLGRGGFGTVYEAYDTRLKRTVAVKVPSFFTGDRIRTARFLREAEAAARVTHPNIATIFDAGAEGMTAYYVMEYIRGNTLSDIVRARGPLPVAQAIQYVLQAAKGLEYAHRQKLIHRDIKPSNLMLDEHGTIKIVDMGLARMGAGTGEAVDDGKEGSLTESGQLLGTLDYMAPEQAKDAHGADYRADIYSLGCTLFYLLTGRALYPERTLALKLLAHHNKPIPSLCALCDDVPAELESVYRKMVAKDPSVRYQTMAEVVEALERVAASPEWSATDEDVADVSPLVVPVSVAHRSVVRHPAASRSKRRWGKRPLIIGAAIGLVALLVAAGVVFRFRTAVGTLVVTVNEPGAVVEVDGGKWKLSTSGTHQPVEMEVDEGAHALRVTKDGFQTATRQFQLMADKKVSIDVRLEPAAGPKTQTARKADKNAVKQTPNAQTPEPGRNQSAGATAGKHGDASKVEHPNNAAPRNTGTVVFDVPKNMPATVISIDGTEYLASEIASGLQLPAGRYQAEMRVRDQGGFAVLQR